MRVEELAKACTDALARTHGRLVLPGLASGNTKRLFGRSGPAGEVVSDTEENGKPASIVAFDPVRVLAYLTAKGLIKVQVAVSSDQQ